VRLTAGEAAELLEAPEPRVYEWIEEAELPAQKIRGQYRINRTDLLEWATEHNVAISPRAFRQDGGMPSLAEALRAGGIHDAVPGTSVADVVRALIPRLPLADDDDREALLQILTARGALAFTPVGGGTAIPPVRMPVILTSNDAALALAFLSAPLDVLTPDGRPVDALFVLIAPTVRVHLAMLAKLAAALKGEPLRDALRRRLPAAEILRVAQSVEEEF